MTLEGQSLIGMFYDSAGRERERRQGNGLINRYHYDELGQLASHQIYRGFDVELNDTPLPVWQQQYQYEPDGQLAQINGNQARHYRYDKLGQLQTVSYPQANREEHHAEKVELFSYDSTGNKISEKQSLAQLEAKVNRGNRLLFFSDKHFEYDRFGNLITEKRGKNQSLVTHYEYDCRHRLIKVIKPSGQTITYSYDPFNRRTSKTVNGKTTEFIWQGHKLIAETDNDKHWQSYLYEQDSFRPLALVQGHAQQGKTQLYWYQNDQLGTPIGLTDGFGETLYECQYNGYGQIIDETYHEVGNRAIPDNPLRFQGQYYDEETGLHYNLNRYYDPFVGRYLTQDPIKLAGGWNFYQYVCGNPVKWSDPLGLIKGLSDGVIISTPNQNYRAIAMGVESLSPAQATVLAELPSYGSSTIVKKSLFGQNDLVALSAATGEEFAMFTTGGRRLIVRGNTTSIPIDINKAKVLGEQGWRWSSHVHPDGSLISSQGDRVIIQFFRNKKSGLSEPYGHRSMFNKDSDLISPEWRPFNK